jgi:hypothetical protein
MATDNVSPDSGDTFDRLLDAMPRIADAVNAFDSEKNQRAALDALVRAIGIPVLESVAGTYASGLTGGIPTPGFATTTIPISGSGPVDAHTGDESVATAADAEPVPAKVAALRRRRPGRKWEPVRNIDFHPEGKTSLPDLAEQKQPSNADQRNLVAIFWLEQVAEIENIGVGQVLAAHKACGWPEPARADNALQVTASRHSWIDTKDMTAIETTPLGRNLVQHRMPLKKATEK